MSRTLGIPKALKMTRRELRNFVLSTTVLTGLFTAGAEAAVHHAHPDNICSVDKLSR